jgi:hypothetical protein
MRQVSERLKIFFNNLNWVAGSAEIGANRTATDHGPLIFGGGGGSRAP